MNLYLFPECARLNSGYGIAVDFAYKMLLPNEDDLVVWYTNQNDIPYFHSSDIIIKKPSYKSLKRFLNLCFKRPSLEIKKEQLLFLRSFEFDVIYCDEVIFYRAIRELFPDKYIKVRFHNCYARIRDRKRLLNLKSDWKFNVNLNCFYKLESEIFKDDNAEKIFLSEEDRTFYSLMTGRKDAVVWAFMPNMNIAYANRGSILYKKKIVWYGGVSTHKKASLRYFIKQIFYRIHKRRLDIEFHKEAFL